MSQINLRSKIRQEPRPVLIRQIFDTSPRLKNGILQARSFESIIDPVQRKRFRPILKFPTKFWKSMSIHEGGQLSARAWALWYLMIARMNADWSSFRDVGKPFYNELERETQYEYYPAPITTFQGREYSISLADAARFLGERSDRMAPLVMAIHATKVSFALGWWRYADGRRTHMRLMDCELVGQEIRYRPNAEFLQSYHQARSFGKLDLWAISQIKNRYAMRLYPMVATRAGYSPLALKPWSLSAAKLVAMAGYSWDGHLGNLRNRVIKPLLKEMKAHVVTFDLEVSDTDLIDAVPAPGLSSPTRGFEFTIQKGSVPFHGVQASELSLEDREFIRTAYGLAPSDRPALPLVGKAATFTGLQPRELFKRWAAFMELARSPSPSQFEAEVAAILDADGIRDAFPIWLRSLDTDGSNNDKPETGVLPGRSKITVQPVTLSFVEALVHGEEFSDDVDRIAELRSYVAGEWRGTLRAFYDACEDRWAAIIECSDDLWTILDYRNDDFVLHSYQQTLDSIAKLSLNEQLLKLQTVIGLHDRGDGVELCRFLQF